LPIYKTDNMPLSQTKAAIAMREYRERMKKEKGEKAFTEEESVKRAQRRAKAEEKKLDKEIKEYEKILNPTDVVENTDPDSVDEDEEPPMKKGAKSTKGQNLGRVKTLSKKYREIDEIDTDDLEWLYDVPKIVAFINKTWDNDKTRKAYFASSAAVLRDYDSSAEARKAQETYNKPMKKLLEKITDEYKQNIKNDKEDASWVDWTEIIEARKQITDPTDKVIYTLYTDIPPRRALDYSKLKVMRGDASQLDSVDKNFNYVLLSSGGAVKKIALFNYKNSDKKGRYDIKMTTQLKKTIEAYIKKKDIKDGENLFEDKKIRDWTKTLQEIFEKYTGKPMSVNALRKSYATHFIGPSKVSQSQVDDIAEQMGTSADLLRTVYYKVG